jgi:hypothetical protein
LTTSSSHIVAVSLCVVIVGLGVLVLASAHPHVGVVGPGPREAWVAQCSQYEQRAAHASPLSRRLLRESPSVTRYVSIPPRTAGLRAISIQLQTASELHGAMSLSLGPWPGREHTRSPANPTIGAAFKSITRLRSSNRFRRAITYDRHHRPALCGRSHHLS